MRSFVLGAIALLATAAVASAGVTVGISDAPGSIGGGIVLDTTVPDVPTTLTLYMNFVVDANSPLGAQSVEGRMAVDAAGSGLAIVTDWMYGTAGPYPWTAPYNNVQTYIPYMESHYNQESVDGVFTAGKMWDPGYWTNLAASQGQLTNTSCAGLYASAGRIGGVASTAGRAKGGPGGAFLPGDGTMTLAVLTVTVPGDIPVGTYNLTVCDGTYNDVDTGSALDIAPGDALVLEIVPEPTAALLLIGALPFLRRRR
jgi:hypothetical protein